MKRHTRYPLEERDKPTSCDFKLSADTLHLQSSGHDLSGRTIQRRLSPQDILQLQRTIGNQAVQRMLKQPDKKPVPTWTDLPDYAQQALGTAKFDQAWFGKKDEKTRLTVLNLFVKLRGLGLWGFVASKDSEDSSGDGAFQFLCSDVAGLKKTLTTSDDYTDPEKSDKEWSSREKRASGQLHFKHFKGWDDAKVQAHIDQQGLLLKSNLWWLTLGIAPLYQAIRHGIDDAQDGWKDVFAIRDILLGQGWDPTPLVGKNTSSKK